MPGGVEPRAAGRGARDPCRLRRGRRRGGPDQHLRRDPAAAGALRPEARQRDIVRRGALAREAAPGADRHRQPGSDRRDAAARRQARRRLAARRPTPRRPPLLAEAGVDAIHLETQFHPAELEAAIRRRRAGRARLPLIASMTLMPGVTGLETRTACRIARMIARARSRRARRGRRQLRRSKPSGCCARSSELRDAVSLPVWAQARRPRFAEVRDRPLVGVARDVRTPRARAGRTAGASAIGGCCGTAPASIAALRARARPLAGQGGVMTLLLARRPPAARCLLRR